MMLLSHFAASLALAVFGVHGYDASAYDNVGNFLHSLALALLTDRFPMQVVS